MYTEDGTLILDIHDLVTWSIEYYRKHLYSPDQSKKQEKQKNLNRSDSAKQSNLLDKVDFSEPSQNPPVSNETQNLSALTVEAKSSNIKQNIGPTKHEIKRILDEYDRTSKIEAKKLFRWPIEIWVSCGEQFVSPKSVDLTENLKMMQREQVERAEQELGKQIHTLRQMAGRRLTSLSTGEYKAIKNPDLPVVKEGHWSEVTYEEEIKRNEVNQLKVI